MKIFSFISCPSFRLPSIYKTATRIASVILTIATPGRFGIMSSMTTVTDKIAASRLTLHELAAAAGVPYITAWRWANGRSPQKLHQIAGLARALDLTTSDLVPDAETEEVTK